MADDKKINEKKQRLLAQLREMFQIDQPDLDFGLYRIMHAKRGQVEAFLETEFDQLIDKVFADRGARHEEPEVVLHWANKDKTLYDIIDINGTHNLPNLGKYGEVRLLEEECHWRMLAGEEN